MQKYKLMHKDDICGYFTFDEETGRICEYKDLGNGLSPFLGNCDEHKLKKWWEMRAIPGTRYFLKDIMKESGCINAEVYLAKNLALSIIDTYWVCPEELSLKYGDLNIKNFAKGTDEKLPYHNETSYLDYNASLGGQMDKYWDFSQGTPILVKESYRHFGQQALNEVFAANIHRMQNTNVPFVQYTASKTEDNGILCKCPAFTSDTVEFIPAYEIVESQKPSNDVSLYDHYIKCCIENGIDPDAIQQYMDYQTMTDFIISNTDEHLLNFGVLRNPDTMKIVGPAPIFDSGNSMFYKEGRRKSLTRIEILETKITSFYKTEEKMLSKVKNRNIVDLSCLPSAEQVKYFYENADVPEWKASFISEAYDKKLVMANEFQNGKVISLYNEKNSRLFAICTAVGALKL